MKNTVIFDMDGVLVDSEYTFLESKAAILKAAGHEKDQSYHYQFMGTTSEFMWKTMKEELNLPLPIETYMKDMNQRREEIMKRDGIKSVKHVTAFVKKLADAGFTLGVASSSRKAEIETNLAELGLTAYFSQCVSSEEVAHSKPAPDVFLRTAALLNAAPETCIVIEDTKNGSRAAKAAGMYCIGFANPLYPPQELVADEIIQSFHEIEIEKLKQL